MPTADETLDHTPLTFGKYAGLTPNEIAETKGKQGEQYIVWMYTNVTNKPTCSFLLAKECGYLDAGEQEDIAFNSRNLAAGEIQGKK